MTHNQMPLHHISLLYKSLHHISLLHLPYCIFLPHLPLLHISPSMRPSNLYRSTTTCHSVICPYIMHPSSICPSPLPRVPQSHALHHIPLHLMSLHHVSPSTNPNTHRQDGGITKGQCRNDANI
jgi:hypothetical protein